MTGSGSEGRTDRWSDIDLAFGVPDAEALARIMADWTDRMYRHHGAVHHFDMPVGATVYRVFLLPGTLQVDLAFAPAAEFGPRARTFRLLSGTARTEMVGGTGPSAESLVGMGWLYALHARTCIRRGQVWRAEYMVGRMRDVVLQLACLRCGLDIHHARDADRLPENVRTPLAASLVRELTSGELSRAFAIVSEALQREATVADPVLGARLADTLSELVRTAAGD